jgi:hypothetical protein
VYPFTVFFSAFQSKILKGIFIRETVKDNIKKCLKKKNYEKFLA